MNLTTLLVIIFIHHTYFPAYYEASIFLRRTSKTSISTFNIDISTTQYVIEGISIRLDNRLEKDEDKDEDEEKVLKDADDFNEHQYQQQEDQIQDAIKSMIRNRLLSSTHPNELDITTIIRIRLYGTDSPQESLNAVQLTMLKLAMIDALDLTEFSYSSIEDSLSWQNLISVDTIELLTYFTLDVTMIIKFPENSVIYSNSDDFISKYTHSTCCWMKGQDAYDQQRSSAPNNSRKADIETVVFNRTQIINLSALPTSYPTESPTPNITGNTYPNNSSQTSVNLSAALAIIAICVASIPLLMYMLYTKVLKPRWENRRPDPLQMIDYGRNLNRGSSSNSNSNENRIVLSRHNSTNTAMSVDSNRSDRSNRGNRLTLTRGSGSGSRRTLVAIPTPIQGISIVDLDARPVEVSSASIVMLPGDFNRPFVVDGPNTSPRKMNALFVKSIDFVNVEQFSRYSNNRLYNYYDDNNDDNDGSDEEEGEEEGEEDQYLENDSDVDSDNHEDHNMNNEIQRSSSSSHGRRHNDGHSNSNNLQRQNNDSGVQLMSFTSLFPQEVSWRAFGIEWN